METVIDFVQSANWVWLFILISNMVAAFFIIFIERKDPTSIWSWVLVLIFLPVIGFILYFLLGRKLRQKHLFRWKGPKDLGLRDIIDEQAEQLRDGTYPFHDEAVRAHQKILYMQLSNNLAVYTQNNEVAIYTYGPDKFNQLLADIKEAKNHIHMQYYIYRDDALGMRIIQALMEKVQQGVSVRFLYDDIGSKGLKNKTIRQMQAAGIQTEVFFPSIFPLINPRLNFRNHRKIVVIDGEVGYVGGFNVGNEYISEDDNYGYWRDTHMRICGSAVYALQTRFILDWNAATKQHVLEYNECLYPPVSATGNVGLQIVSSGPDSEWEAVKNGYLKMIMNAQRYVYIQTPYFVPDDAIMEAVRVASLSGVDVRIMIPAVPDHKIVYFATMSYIGDLLKAGAKIYLYEKGFLHAKTVVIDDIVSTIGTTNFDVRSFKLNFEVNAFIYDTALSIKNREIFEQDLLNSKQLLMEDYSERSVWLKIGESCARLISPIL